MNILDCASSVRGEYTRLCDGFATPFTLDGHSYMLVSVSLVAHPDFAGYTALEANYQDLYRSVTLKVVGLGNDLGFEYQYQPK